RDRRDDADHVPVLNRRLLVLPGADILVPHENVHEAAEPPVVGIQMLLQIREPRGEAAHRLPHRAGLHLDGIEVSRIRPQRGRNQYLSWHVRISLLPFYALASASVCRISSSSNCPRPSASAQACISTAFPWRTDTITYVYHGHACSR